MTTESIARMPDASAIESVLVKGDLSQLTEAQRLSYYQTLCKSLGLNPLTQPFQYLTLQGKLILYARRDATEQLRKVHGVSIEKLEKDRHEDVYIVTAYARDATGRTDASTGAVALGSLKGEALANALMKCETKAKRRVTLSICGLGLLDETEVETIPSAKVLPAVDVATGEEAPSVPMVAQAPAGYADWLLELESVADNGLPALQEAFKAASAEFRAHLTKQDRGAAAALKARASKVAA